MIEWAKLKDNDYVAEFAHREKSVYFFDINEKYEIKGWTHGLTSHAIKHLEEFDYPYCDLLYQKAKNIIKDIPSLYLFNKITKTTEVDKNKAFSKCTNGVIINTLDRINDKIKTQEKLNEYDKKFINIIQKFSDKYENIIKNYLNDAIDVDGQTEVFIIDQLLNYKIVKFTANFMASEVLMFYKLDNGLYMMQNKSSKKLMTLFTLKSRDEVLYRFDPNPKLKFSPIIGNAIKKVAK